jgi:chemotaxis protein methyltransferase CheR
MDSLGHAPSERMRFIPSPPIGSIPTLTDRDMATIVRLVYEKSGISLHAGKRALVTARLQKLLRRSGVNTFREYLRLLEADKTGAELTAMLDAIATNHTAFFREAQHFDYLVKIVLPALREKAQFEPIYAWSAACSSGEEPYTIAMTAVELLGDQARRSVQILASDLSTKALMKAAAGVYKADRVEGIPRHLVLKYFEKQPAMPGTVRISESIRRMIEFRQLNLLESPPRGRHFDFIFCRNVLIYFDRVVQQRVVAQLEDRLARGGYLFTSHSESLNGLRHGLTWVAPAVYRRDH